MCYRVAPAFDQRGIQVIKLLRYKTTVQHKSGLFLY